MKKQLSIAVNPTLNAILQPLNFVMKKVSNQVNGQKWLINCVHGPLKKQVRWNIFLKKADMSSGTYVQDCVVLFY